MIAEYAIASSAARVNSAALIKPRGSSAGTKFNNVVAIEPISTAKLSHF
jgi:hypothetical protein